MAGVQPLPNEPCDAICSTRSDPRSSLLLHQWQKAEHIYQGGLPAVACYLRGSDRPMASGSAPARYPLGLGLLAATRTNAHDLRRRSTIALCSHEFGIWPLARATRLGDASTAYSPGSLTERVARSPRQTILLLQHSTIFPAPHRRASALKLYGAWSPARCFEPTTPLLAAWMLYVGGYLWFHCFPMTRCRECDVLLRCRSVGICFEARLGPSRRLGSPPPQPQKAVAVVHADILTSSEVSSGDLILYVDVSVAASLVVHVHSAVYLNIPHVFVVLVGDVARVHGMNGCNVSVVDSGYNSVGSFPTAVLLALIIYSICCSRSLVLLNSTTVPCLG